MNRNLSCSVGSKAGIEVATVTSSAPFESGNPLVCVKAHQYSMGFSRLQATVRFKWLLSPSPCFSSGMLPSGNRNCTTGYYNIGRNDNLWSSSGSSSAYATYWNFNYNYGQVNRNSNNRSNGLSVRCVRDSEGASLQDFFAPSALRKSMKGKSMKDFASSCLHAFMH